MYAQPLVKINGDGARRMPWAAVDLLITGLEGQTIRHTVHQNSTETLVTDYWSPETGERIRVTATYAI